MIMPTPFAASLSVLVVSGLAVTGCSSSTSSSPSDTPAPSVSSGAATGSSAAAPGQAVCDEAEMQKQVDRVLTAGGGMSLISFDGFQCATGWGAAKITAGPPDTTMILIFYDEGDGWLPAPMDVCGASQADSRVPAELYDFACPSS